MTIIIITTAMIIAIVLMSIIFYIISTAKLHLCVLHSFWSVLPIDSSKEAVSFCLLVHEASSALMSIEDLKK